jgi:subtilisin family serine protease
VSRPSRSWRAELRARFGARRAPWGALLAGLLLGASVSAQETQGCAPFDESYPHVETQLDDGAVFRVAAAGTGIAPGASGDGGGIVRLPDPPAFDRDSDRDFDRAFDRDFDRDAAPAGRGEASEVLLALPKGEDGELPEGAALGPGARLSGSFFSPVLCATVARVVGPPAARAEELVTAVPETATVVPNSVYVSAQAEVTPLAPPGSPETGPDPYRALQYGLDRSGVERARPLSNGAGVRVAVLDSAPAQGHRDLARVRVERFPGGPGEAPAVHGTLVAGLIAATENNAFGMAGVAPGVDLLAVPVCTPAGASAADRCLLYDLLRGVDRAWEQEARIVNLSIVGPANPLLERSMARLDELGVLVVASAGNEGSDAPRFPAAYPSVIGVGAVDREGARYARSNHGVSAELMAPGVEILSAVPGDAFAFGSGTSFAAAHVSGVLGVLLGAGTQPADARAALFREALDAAEGRAGAPRLPPVCDVLERLGKTCPSP